MTWIFLAASALDRAARGMTHGRVNLTRIPRESLSAVIMGLMVRNYICLRFQPNPLALTEKKHCGSKSERVAYTITSSTSLFRGVYDPLSFTPSSVKIYKSTSTRSCTTAEGSITTTRNTTLSHIPRRPARTGQEENAP